MRSRIIKTRWHAFLDYMTALLLLISPWLFDFTRDTLSTRIGVISGAIVLIMSVFSRNEGGLIRVIPMPIHLIMDIVLGFAILILPYLPTQELPHIVLLLVGLMLICSGIFTENSIEQHEIPVSVPEKDAHIQGNKR